MKNLKLIIFIFFLVINLSFSNSFPSKNVDIKLRVVDPVTIDSIADDIEYSEKKDKAGNIMYYEYIPLVIKIDKNMENMDIKLPEILNLKADNGTKITVKTKSNLSTNSSLISLDQEKDKITKKVYFKLDMNTENLFHELSGKGKIILNYN